MARYFGSVHKVAKAILVAGGVLAALIAVTMLCVNLYVQSTGVQVRIQKALGDAAHMQVKLTGANFTPWNGLKLVGLEAPQTDRLHPGDFFQSPEIHARIAIMPLLRRRCVVTELAILDSAVTWFQDEKGSWRLPGAEATPPSEEAASVPPIPSPTPPLSPQPPTAAPAVSGPIFTLAVDHFRLKRGAMEFLDRGGRSVAALTGVNVDCPNPSAAAVTGKARINEAMIKGFLKLRDMSADFSFAGGNLRLPNLDANLAQGRIGGSFEMETGVQDSPFSADVRFESIDIARVIPPKFQSMVSAEGTLSGFLKASGKSLRRNRSPVWVR